MYIFEYVFNINACLIFLVWLPSAPAESRCAIRDLCGPDFFLKLSTQRYLFLLRNNKIQENMPLSSAVDFSFSTAPRVFLWFCYRLPLGVWPRACVRGEGPDRHLHDWCRGEGSADARSLKVTVNTWPRWFSRARGKTFTQNSWYFFAALK